jgi:hypothetical protein
VKIERSEQKMSAAAQIDALAGPLSRLLRSARLESPFGRSHPILSDAHALLSFASKPKRRSDVMHGHNGTHMDVPAHYAREGPDPKRLFLHSVLADPLIGPAKLLDVSVAPQSPLPVEAIHAWESRHSAIVKDEIVVFNFGGHRK